MTELVEALCGAAGAALVLLARWVIGKLREDELPERPVPERPPRRERWAPQVQPAAAWYRYDAVVHPRMSDGYEGTLERTLAVRVRRGSESLGIGLVDLDDQGFEEKLNALVRTAEERAAALNAAYDEVGQT